MSDTALITCFTQNSGHALSLPLQNPGQFIRPALTATPSTASDFSIDASGNMVFGDSKTQQTPPPAFADLNKVTAVLSTTLALVQPVQMADDPWWVDGEILYV